MRAAALTRGRERTGHIAGTPRLFVVPLVLSTLALLPTGCSEDKTINQTTSGTTDPDGGLLMTITDVRIGSDRRPVVEFTLEDENGEPMALDDLDRNPRFILAWIEEDPLTGLSKYQSYVTRTANGANYDLDGVTTPPALASAVQPTTDSGGTMKELGPGEYSYTFGNALPVNYDRDATHTLGAYVTRGGGTWVVNPIFDFVPSGAAVTVMREIVTTDACNGCHNPIEAHGGSRREVALCVLCHTDQGADPETGETIEFSAMIHRIHTGEDLAILPFYIVGHNQSVHDYSEVVFPQDTRNCVTCHTGGAESDHWKTKPSRNACGGCHDDVNFATGENHDDGLAQDTDQLCTLCHRSNTGIEFDKSVPGAHTVPLQSSVNPGLTLTIVDVQNMVPGGQPSVQFTIADSGGPVDIATVNRVAILFAGPTDDYTQLISLDHRFNIQGSGSIGTLTVNGVGDYTFAPDGYVIPAGASGTWSVGLESRTENIAAGSVNVRFGANNPVVHVDVADGTLGGGTPVARRQIVDEAKCNKCHKDLVMHGNLRTEIDYCVMCHNLWGTDETRRPGLDPDTNPPESIDFKYMIHRIHRGEHLENDYTIYGFGGSAHDFTEVRFPGDLRDCETCHIAGTQYLPGVDTAAALVVNIGGVTVPQADAIRPPTTAACTGCHDGDSTLIHAQLNSIINDEFDWGESCATCHGEGSAFAVSDEHAVD